MDEQREFIPTDMLDAIEACDARCEAIVDDLGGHADTVRTPPVAYHYTDGTGLLGILGSSAIRMTDIFGLNDPTELRHGVTHACEILDAEARAGHPAAQIFAQQFSAFPDSVEAIAHFFVACFSHNGDDLGQWRAYGNNGFGFALGFDGALLEETFVLSNAERNPNNSTFSIRYDDKSLRAVQRALVDEVLPLISLPESRRLDNGTINQFMKELSIRLSLSVVRAALFFKHEGYKNEAEYRFLHIRPTNDTVDDLKHRARGYSLVRFMEFNWRRVGTQLLREIVIGPAANEVAARSFVEKCLRRAGIDPETVSVRRSVIPYRAG